MTEANDVERAAKKRGSRRSLWIFIVKLCVAAGLLIWLFASGRLDLSPLRDVPRWGYLALAAVLLLISMLLPVWRWYGLLRVQQLEIGWLTALRITWMGQFASIFLPGAAGGDLAKAYLACRHQPSARTRAVSTVLLDRVFGLHSLLTLGSVAGATLLLGEYDVRQSVVAWSPIVLLGVATGGLFLLSWPPTCAFALRLLPGRFRTAVEDSFALYRSGWRRMLCLWLFSALCNISAIAPYYFTAVAFDIEVSPAQAVTVMPLVILSNTLPISPGGVGVGETASSLLFAQFGIAMGATIMLVVRLLTLIFRLPGGLLYILAGRGAWPQRSVENPTNSPG